MGIVIHRQSSNLHTPCSPLSSPLLSSSASLWPSRPPPPSSPLSWLAGPPPLLPHTLVLGTVSGGSALPALALLGAKKLLLAGALLLPSNKALLRLEEFSVYQTKTIKITGSP